MQLIGYIGRIILVLLPLIMANAFSSAALAQPANPNSVAQMSRYAPRVAKVKKRCDRFHREYTDIINEIGDDVLRSYNADFKLSQKTFNNEAEKKAANKLRDFHQRERLQGEIYAESLHKACDEFAIARQIKEAKNKCNKSKATRLLKRLRNLVNALKREYDAAKALGNQSKIGVKDAKRKYEDAKVLYENALKYPVTPCKTKKKTGDVDSGGVTIHLPDIGGPPEALPTTTRAKINLCSLNDDQPGISEYSDSCRNWSALLGKWTNPDYGGTISFELRPDNTVSAYIEKVSERMLKQGYSRNMEIARGWEFGGIDAGTWKFFSRNGAVLSAKMPNREAGTIFGSPEWVQGGLIHISRDRPDMVNLPARLEGRISDFKDWVRVDSEDSNIAKHPPISRICLENGVPVCGIKDNDPKLFNTICEVEKQGYRPIHMVECKTSNTSAKSPAFNYQCTHLSKPACAIDLKGLKRTFSNICEAREKNHSVLYEGECKSNPILGSDANAMLCPADYKPVCAKKNIQSRTFKNACEAKREKFEIQSQGACQ